MRGMVGKSLPYRKLVGHRGHALPWQRPNQIEQTYEEMWTDLKERSATARFFNPKYGGLTRKPRGLEYTCSCEYSNGGMLYN